MGSKIYANYLKINLIKKSDGDGNNSKAVMREYNQKNLIKKATTWVTKTTETFDVILVDNEEKVMKSDGHRNS